MGLSAGTRLGPYEILAVLGAGGMGEVYRARDARLEREVAVKVIHPRFAADADLLRRFEQEARAASQLDHPNILVVHDIGSHEGSPYIVSELLEGESLREKLGAPLPPKKAVEYAAQVGHGLAAAHEKGIVHRDLKPENLFVTRDGRIKILDFGLAKLTEPTLPSISLTEAPTAALKTEPGVVVGTVGYMSPEQVRGEPVDHCSDIFSFGSILYEMLTSERAFGRETGIETMNAILKEEPALLISGSPMLSPEMDRIVRRCLEKNREERFQSASDLAFALESITGHSAASGGARATGVPADRRKQLGRRFAAALALAAVAGVAFFAGGRSAEVPAPAFHQLTFRRGTILTARFAADGNSVVFGAAWDGGPFQIYTMRPDGPESSPLALPPADLLAISSSGELAVSLGRQFGWMDTGTLARVPLAGGAPREVLEAVQEADWAPDTSNLAVVRRVGARRRLEFPIGRLMYETASWLSHPRVSPDGSSVAFIDHPIYGDDRGTVTVVDRTGQKRMLTPEWTSVQGLAWAPGGREVWFTASEKGTNCALKAVTLSGRVRTVANVAGRLTLLDISRQGRALVSRDLSRVLVNARSPGESAERDLSWLDNSQCTDLSADGQWMLFTESGEGGGQRYGAYLRKMDGSPAVRLGDGQATVLSPDGKWALAIVYGNPDELWMLPTGAGEAKKVPRGAIARFHWAGWLPDGKGILFTGNEAGKLLRIYAHDLASGKTRAVTPETVGYLAPVTPDSRFVPSLDAERRVRLYPLDGRGENKPLAGLEPGDLPLRWSRDGRFLFLRRRGDLPLRVERLERATGRAEPWLELMPAERSGLFGVSTISISEDGKAYAYSYRRLLSELYLVEGLNGRR